MIIPVSPSVHKDTKDAYIKEPDLGENIIWSCEHIDRCSNPLYVGRCREDCFNRYRGGN
jgi:hypothetical protein